LGSNWAIELASSIALIGHRAEWSAWAITS
jgi:hypothetical protein